MHGGEYPLRSPHGPPIDRAVEGLRFPVEQAFEDVAAWLLASFHHSPGTIAHCHVRMPDGGSDGFMIARHTEIDLPRVGGKVGPTEGRDGIEQKQRSVR